MRLLLFIMLLLYGQMAPMPTNFHTMQKVEKNGMSVEWIIQEDQINFEVFAPEHGWVAIGFNPENRLPGTHLIMGKIEGGSCTISDRYIVNFGNHQAAKELGGKNHLSNIEGRECWKGTLLKFSIDKTPKDAFHYPLQQGKSYTLWIAYSESDDFQHHSSMRTSVEITL